MGIAIKYGIKIQEHVVSCIEKAVKPVGKDKEANLNNVYK
jgi:hypothetical protein